MYDCDPSDNTPSTCGGSHLSSLLASTHTHTNSTLKVWIAMVTKSFIMPACEGHVRMVAKVLASGVSVGHTGREAQPDTSHAW